MKKDTDTGTGGQKRRRRRTVQYLLFFVGCVLFVDALVGDRGVLQMRQTDEEYSRLERQLVALRVENARLLEESRRLKHDPKAIEDLARRDLGLIKKGEKVFIIRDAGPADGRAGHTK